MSSTKGTSAIWMAALLVGSIGALSGCAADSAEDVEAEGESEVDGESSELFGRTDGSTQTKLGLLSIIAWGKSTRVNTVAGTLNTLSNVVGLKFPQGWVCETEFKLTGTLANGARLERTQRAKCGYTRSYVNLINKENIEFKSGTKICIAVRDATNDSTGARTLFASTLACVTVKR